MGKMSQNTICEKSENRILSFVSFKVLWNFLTFPISSILKAVTHRNNGGDLTRTRERNRCVPPTKQEWAEQCLQFNFFPTCIEHQAIHGYKQGLPDYFLSEQNVPFLFSLFLICQKIIPVIFINVMSLKICPLFYLPLYTMLVGKCFHYIPNV